MARRKSKAKRAGCPAGSRYKVTTKKGRKVSCHTTKKAARCKRKKGQRVVKIGK